VNVVAWHRLDVTEQLWSDASRAALIQRLPAAAALVGPTLQG